MKNAQELKKKMTETLAWFDKATQDEVLDRITELECELIILASQTPNCLRGGHLPNMLHTSLDNTLQLFLDVGALKETLVPRRKQ